MEPKYRLPVSRSQAGMLLPRKTENVVLSGERYQALLTVGRQNEVFNLFIF